MGSRPASSDNGRGIFDPAKPFQGIVVCCTSIVLDKRTQIENKTAELGGLHKADLTPEVTHLIVGDYNTAKYRHVAKERPDIRVMAAGWIDAVMDLWTTDEAIYFDALETEWQLLALQTNGGEFDETTDMFTERGRLLCCLSGFENNGERQRLIDTIASNGGRYTGDLTRKVTHLIVSKPEGRKYTAAKDWDIYIVAAEWLFDSAERGMILDETKYNPTLSKELRGKGAWNRRSLTTAAGKRPRGDGPAVVEDGRRKLRKTTSMKLSSQRENLWGDILGNPAEGSAPREPQPQEVGPVTSAATSSRPTKGPSMATRPLAPLETGQDADVFSACVFHVEGFPTARKDILVRTVVSLGGEVSSSLADLESSPYNFRLVIVPQAAMPDTRPVVSKETHLVTEFYIEKCFYKKQFFHPASHVIGQPFPTFPIPDFEGLSISTGGFTGVDLNQIDKAVRQLGARYEERFTPQSSVLLLPSLEGIRKQKLDLAVAWRVPVLDARWLWECISTGHKLPFRSFLFPDLAQNLSSEPEETTDQGKGKTPLQRIRHEPTARVSQPSDSTPGPPTAKPPPPPPRREITKDDSNTMTIDFETAPTHQSDSKESSRHSAPLSEASTSEINRLPSPRKLDRPEPRKPISRVVSEVADSDAASDLMPLDSPAPDPPRASRAAAARDKAAALASERLALSTRVASLLGAPPAADRPAPARRPRRRGLTGRAVSNVSSGSGGGGAGDEAGAGAATTVHSAAGFEDAAGAVPRPPSTQLDYEDPEAERAKAELLRKMSGATGEEPPGWALARAEKVTLRDFREDGTRKVARGMRKR